MERLEQFYKDLKRSISGEVYTDAFSTHVYSVDASIYEIIPHAIVLPKTTEDILQTILVGKKYNLPITARGAGTGITGGCLGQGVVIDTSKYLNKILEINFDEGYAICEPGVVQDQLNEALALRGYRLGPDTSTGNRATLGGMLANNAAGARSLFYGKMVDHILEVDLALSNGELISLGAQRSNRSFDIEKKLATLVKKYEKDIQDYFPKLPRQASGYNLDELIKSNPPNYAKIIAGSEGTLGVITKMKLKISPKPKHIGFCLIFFDDIIEGLSSVEKILSYHPLSVEMIDDKILQAGKNSKPMQGKLVWLKEVPKMILVVEFQGDTHQIMQDRVTAFFEEIQTLKIGSTPKMLLDKQEMEEVWSLRKAGLGLLLSKRTYSRAIAFIEDISIPPKNLACFMEEFFQLLKKQHKDAGIYGHVGSGCMHIRPYIDLRDPEEIKVMEQLMLEVTDLLLKYQGILSGEHGDGYIRSWLNEKLFGKQLYQAFIELKAIFDPPGLMNPHKIVNGLHFNHDLRMNPQVIQNQLDTFLDFSKEGGFELSADLCNGNGLCRKPEKLMCPSFQATLDEHDTTRARAQSLRAIINGRLPREEFYKKDLQSIFDLCIECKGCKTECPSNVDIAKMKSEMLYQFHKKNSIPLRSKIFAHIHRINTLIAPFAKIVNYFSEQNYTKFFMKQLGITDQRDLPRLSNQTFTKTYNLSESNQKKNKTIVLYIDTFTQFYYPKIGLSACEILESLDFQVVIPKIHCCGRPMISKGLLKDAQDASKKILTELYPYAQEQLEIIVLEPSCLSAFRDDYLSFFKNESSTYAEMAKLVAGSCFSLEEFLLRENLCNQIRIREETQNPLIFHRHCHDKALEKNNFLAKLFEQLKINATEIPSGCCGVAGSFGYESEHYHISKKIGELHLLPFIRQYPENSWIIANGVSCRQQIIHGTGRQALHLSEFLAQVISNTQNHSDERSRMITTEF